MSDTTLKQVIREVLKEELRIIQIAVGISVTKDASITETLTLIRALPGVITLSVLQKAKMSQTGHKNFYINVKYIPPQGDVFDIMDGFGKAVKSLGGVEIVHIYQVGGADVTDRNGQPVIY